jgi:hypothetical protein
MRTSSTASGSGNLLSTDLSVLVAIKTIEAITAVAARAA